MSERERDEMALVIGKTNPKRRHVYIDGIDACLDIADALMAAGFRYAPTVLREVVADLPRIYDERGHDDDWGVRVIYVEQLANALRDRIEADQ